MKKCSTKLKNTASSNHKISSYFAKLPTASQCSTSAPGATVDPKSTAILEAITNLPQCSTTPDTLPQPVTPENRKRKSQEDTPPSPDVIPSSLDTHPIKLKNCFRFRKLEKPSPPKRKSPRSQKSPKSLHTINIAVLENFVEVRPSPNDLMVQKASEIQKSNELTPTKSPSVISQTQQRAKVKMKLNFSPQKKVVLLDDDNWGDDWDDQDVPHLLDLKVLQRCRIVTMEKSCGRIKMLLSDELLTAWCIVEGFWCNMRMEPGDIVSISATYNHSLAAWHVCSDYGIIVYEPDHLVSSTTVVGAHFCLRRSILNDNYRGFDPSNRVMVIGVLVHQLFQDVLKMNVSDYNEIYAIVKRIIEDKETICMLYEACLDVNDVIQEVRTFIPHIISFVMEHTPQPVGAIRKAVTRENWKGIIDNVQDIEENIWCPQLGLKGKVDVTLVSNGATIPLELKTGKASFSIDHRGQVMLYVMMMNQLGYEVPTGLLFYLREGALREISLKHVEKRDLIMLRNELTYYLTRPVDSDKLVLDLPEPINHHSACSSCPYNTICCTYLQHENYKLENNPLSDLKENLLSHLEPQHIAYFIKWSSLLRLEASCNEGNKELKEIYTVPPEKREEKGQSIINLQIKQVEESDTMFKHTFIKVNSTKLPNLQTSGLNVGDYIVVSTNTRPAVSSGLLATIDNATVTLNLDRDLQKRYPNSRFHLDTYNSSISQTFNMASLALLLEATDQAAKLRKIVIDKTPPTFQSKLPKAVATKGVSVLRTLNKNQQKAVLKALSCNDYLLIKGMPGTGKTATIVALIQILVELKKSVLITSHTHSAVDNVCLRLQKLGIDLLRLGSLSKINAKLHSYSEKVRTQDCTTPEQLNEIYNTAQVVAVTCLGSGHSVLSKRTFDVCIIDESTQILQCSVLRALNASHKFVLIGDPEQLPPIVKNREAISHGLSESLFQRLDAPPATVSLIYNYRMNKPITNMANSLTYNGELLVANDDIANATLHIHELNKLCADYSNELWILKTLDVKLQSAIKVLDTGPVWMNSSQLPQETTSDSTKYSNRYETALIVKLTEALLKGGVATSAIGVIAPYRAQVALISTVLKHKDIEVSTVDQFQGRDKEVVIYSCTKSAENLSIGVQHEILEDKRRLTVAITRAKHKFILIGDVATVKRYSPFAKLLDCLDDSCFICLKNGELGFSWDAIMK